MKHFTIIIIFIFSLTFANDINIRAIVNADKVRIREKPTVNSQIISIINKNDVVNILERSLSTEFIDKMYEYWFKVKIGNITGWIYGYYLKDFSGFKYRILTIKTEYSQNNFTYQGSNKTRNNCELQLTCPSIWTLSGSSVINDYQGWKIGEIHSVKILGDKQSKDAIIKDLCSNAKCISNIRLNTINPITRIITSVVYEGGAPEWTGTWFPVTYYITYDKNKLVELSFYLRDLNDKLLLKMFDDISKTVIIK